MPVNHEKCLRYKDTWAAPGSNLYAALEEKDNKKAEQIYQECEKRLRDEQKPNRIVFDSPVETVVQFDVTLRTSEGNQCSLGVGCDETGICHAEVMGEPSQCRAKNA